jgi:hypothetical protein
MRPMGWVHCRKRYGALLALAALALQITLSFGHVHLDGVGRAAPHAAIAGTHKVALAQSAPQMPTQNPSGDDDYCAICASIFLVSSSFVSEPPELPIPVGFVRIKHSFSVARGVTVPRRFAFRSRAPPAA